MAAGRAEGQREGYTLLKWAELFHGRPVGLLWPQRTNKAKVDFVLMEVFQEEGPLPGPEWALV